MRLQLLVIATFAISVMSCNQTATTSTTEQKTETAAPVAAAKPTSNLDQHGTDNLMSLLSSYYELKDALVATAAQKADEAASHVLTAAETMRHELGDTNPAIRATLDTVMKESEGIVNLKDSTCNKKRVIFQNVSDRIYGIAKTAGLKNAKVYRQFCPMAFEEKGAHWMSNVEEIKNPYLPKKMLECGEVQDSL